MSTSHPMPRRVFSFPHWTDNPFVNMLYLDAQSQGAEVVGTRTLEDFTRVVSNSTETDAIHIHWTSPIVQKASSVDDARSRLEDFEAAVIQASLRGTKLVWSIHNVLPHDVRFRDEEIALSRFLNEAATRIHVLSSRTVELTSHAYSLDEAKLARVPHSSYWGVYDQSMTREDARAAHGITERDTVIGFVGQLRPYKGVADLIHAVREIQHDDPTVSLLLAGKTWPGDLEVIDELVAGMPRVVRSHAFIPDEELPMWMRTIDVMALPYRAVLNSGSIALAATYGVPVVTPAQAGFVRDFADESWVSTYDSAATNPSAPLAMALRNRMEVGRAPDQAAVAWARAHTPFEMSKEFTDRVLRDL